MINTYDIANENNAVDYSYIYFKSHLSLESDPSTSNTIKSLDSSLDIHIPLVV